MKIEQEIMEDLNKILWKNIDDNVLEPERPMKTQLQNDLKDFISHIITLVQKREREEMLKNLQDAVKHTDPVELKTFLYTDQIINLIKTK